MTIATVLAIFIADYLGLQNVMTAGIIAILTILDTRQDTKRLAVVRFFSTLLAFLIANIVFRSLGFSVFTFGVFLIFFIPASYALKLESGISNCSVLVTHFVLAESISLQWQINGFLLMIIGVSLALLVNYFTPNMTRELEEKIQKIEATMSKALTQMKNRLRNKDMVSSEDIRETLALLDGLISRMHDMAREHSDNQLQFADYYLDYTRMREEQRKILVRLCELIERIDLKVEQTDSLSKIFELTADTLSETNTGVDLLEKIADLYVFYRDSELPKSRDEFEARATLYQILADFEHFLEIKRRFYFEHEDDYLARQG